VTHMQFDELLFNNVSLHQYSIIPKLRHFNRPTDNNAPLKITHIISTVKNRHIFKQNCHN